MRRAPTNVACLLALALGGCGVEPPCPAADLAPLPRAPYWALVSSDFGSTAIAMLDRDGTLITEAWIDSGTTRPGITTTIGGDVVLPTVPLGPGELALIDRLGADVLTRIATPSGTDITQVHLQSTSADETGFRSNPHDVLALGDGRALVTRHNPNLNPDAAPLDRGNDLVVIDLASGALTGSISLAAFDSSEVVDRLPTFFARPSRMALAGSRVIVGLARLDVDFRAPGPGAVAVLDPATETVSALDLAGLVNCGTVAPVSGDAARVLVLCIGDSFAATVAEQRMRSGVAVVAVDASGTARVEQTWRAAEHPELPPPSWAIESLGGSRLVYTSLGIRDAGTHDTLVALDLATSEGRVIETGHGELVLGLGAYDASRSLLLWPDTAVGVRTYDVGAGLDVRPRDVVDTSPCRHLPAREVRALLAE